MNRSCAVWARQLIGISCAAFTLAGCYAKDTVTLAISSEEPAPSIAAELRVLLEQRGIELEVVSGDNSLENRSLLESRGVDLAIIEDDGTSSPTLAALLPLYPGILHILYRSENEDRSLAAVLRHKRIYAGPWGGTAQRLLQLIAAEVGVAGTDYTLLPNPWEQDVEVYFIVGDLLARQSARDLSGYRLYSLSEPSEVGHGSFVDALSLRHPFLQPYVLPRKLYPGLNPDPIATLSVSSLLVAAQDLNNELAYSITEALVEKEQELRRASPLLAIGNEMQSTMARANFSVHPGARRYFERDRPGFLERHVETLSYVISSLLAFASGIVALINWNRRHMKNQIDRYYIDVLDIRGEIPGANSTAGLNQLSDRVRDIQREALQLVVDEKAPADEHMTILVNLSNQVLNEIDGALD